MRSLKCVDGNVCVSTMCMNRSRQLDYICMQGGFRDNSSTTVVLGFSEILLRNMTKLHRLNLGEMMLSYMKQRNNLGINVYISLLTQEG